MVYCNLKQKNKESAVYTFGVAPNDVTGEAEFHSDMRKPTILKQPETGNVPGWILTRLLVKYKDKIENGIFPDKLCYER